MKKKKKTQAQSLPIWLKIFTAIVYIFVLIAGINRSTSINQHWDFIQNKTAQDIARIEFYKVGDKSYVQNLIVTLEDVPTIKKFRLFLSSAIYFSPDHSHVTNSIYSIFYLKNGEKIEFVFGTKEIPDNTVYISFAGKENDAIRFNYDAKIDNKGFLDLLIMIGVFR